MRRLLSASFALALALPACGGAEPPPKVEAAPAPSAAPASSTAATPPKAAADRTQEIEQIAAEAYVWGYPLVVLERTRRTMTAQARVPSNSVQHKKRIASAAEAEPLANPDLLLSSAWLDAKDEPVAIKVPELGGRFYVIELLDVYGNPFAHVGRKSTGGKATTFVVTAPGSTAALPAGATEIKAPTSAVWMLVRTQVDGEADLAKAGALLDKLQVATLSGKPAATPPGPVARPQDVKFAGAEFYDELGELLATFPPPDADKARLERFAKAGIGAGKTPSKTSDDKERLALNDGQKRGEAEIEERFEKLPARKKGWDLDAGFGRWGADVLTRAAYAKRGFDTMLAEEVFAPIVSTDDGDQVLTGAHEYVLHFDKGHAPKADAFWSLSLYDAKTGALVDNAKKRHAVRSTELKPNADGSLDVFVSHAPPKGHEHNWLPAPPANQFVLALRVYQPAAELLAPGYELPAVKKTK